MQELKKLKSDYNKEVKNLFQTRINEVFEKYPKLQTIGVSGSNESNDEGSSSMYVYYDVDSLILNGNSLEDVKDGDDFTFAEAESAAEIIEGIFEDFDDVLEIVFSKYSFDATITKGKIKVE